MLLDEDGRVFGKRRIGVKYQGIQPFVLVLDEPARFFEPASPVLVFAALASMLVPWPNRAGRIVIAICGGLIAFVPAFGTTPGQFLLGTMGPVSAATMVFIVVFLYALITRLYDRLFPSRAFLICVLVIGIVFYPLTIG